MQSAQGVTEDLVTTAAPDTVKVLSDLLDQKMVNLATKGDLTAGSLETRKI